MTRASRILASTFFVAAAALPLSAQKSPLNIKPGLWEMSIQLDMAGAMPPGVDMSKMPPEQKAKMEALMAAQKNTPHIVKSCVTQEEIDNYRVNETGNDTSCKTTVTKSSSTLVEITQTCGGPAAGTRETRIEAPTPTGMKVVSKATSGRGAGTTVNMNGKWLSADCGDTK
jgi:hypothetical protein